jgi:hypothetical protein
MSYRRKGFYNTAPQFTSSFPSFEKTGNKISTKCSFSKLAPEGNEIWSRKRDRKQNQIRETEPELSREENLHLISHRKATNTGQVTTFSNE